MGDPIPNIHYIGVIEESGSRVVFKKYKIELPRALLDELYRIETDKDNGSALAMQEEMTRHYSKEERKLFFSNFLAPRDYTSAYVDPTHFPRIWTQEEYSNREQEIGGKAKEAFQKDAQERREQNRPANPKKLEDYIKERIDNWRIGLRNEYYTVAIQFILSHSYRATGRKYRLTSRPEVKMFSTDTIGWTKYIYHINRDLTIRFDSNFGYGPNVGYFQLGASYKGIEIFPYSSYVRYYYANFRTLLRHTRSYMVKRASWDDALEFVEKHANLALEDPEKFVNDFIVGEVRTMVEGLSRIMCMSQEVFAEQMNPNNVKRPRYLGVSIPRKHDVERYSAYPHEMLMVYKAEKITGALAFLGSIRTLSGILEQVSVYFDIVITLVKRSLAQIRHNIASIADDIKNVEASKYPLVRELEPLVKEIARMDDEISRLQAKSDDEVSSCKETLAETYKRHQDIREGYILKHPLYKQLTIRRSELNGEIRRIDKDIEGRTMFAKRLAACESVGAKADEFRDILNAMRTHEDAIAFKTAESLAQFDLATMTVSDIEEKKASVRTLYMQEHDDFHELIQRRNEILNQIMQFDTVS